jgi:Beta-lactamase
MENEVQSTMDRLVESGAERGIQVAVYRNGEQVVDAVAGIADPASGRLVTSATPLLQLLDLQGRDGHLGPPGRRARGVLRRSAVTAG